jgi:hypothetical protein
MNEGAHHIADLVDMNDPRAVMAETRSIVAGFFPRFDFNRLDKVFEDVILLFSGKFPGYKACNTGYHDLKHTTDALLAMIRLIDGAVLSSLELSYRNVNLALVATLLHDAGYIQESSDDTGTGAKYTMTHVERSAAFLKRYFAEHGYSRQEALDGESVIKCTGLGDGFRDIHFSSKQIELIGKMLGTADLLGQMADRIYLEKLSLLYNEFVEGKVGGYSDDLDLFRKTVDFYYQTRIRFRGQLGGVYKFARIHFKHRLRIDRDLYEDAIRDNIDHIKRILTAGPGSYSNFLRRCTGLSVTNDSGIKL